MSDSPPPPASEETLWEGHPSLWHWFWLLVVGVVTVPLIVGIGILIWVFVQRGSTVYTVTSKRVQIRQGIVTKTSRELRLQDIRSINSQATLGYGYVEFSSAATDDAEVVFHGIWNVKQVVALVQSRQN
jgi:Bacterial PH domain